MPPSVVLFAFGRSDKAGNFTRTDVAACHVHTLRECWVLFDVVVTVLWESTATTTTKITIM